MDYAVKQALIACGGHGTRLSPALNPKQCKPLIEYKGQTMLEHLIDGLKEGGIERFVLEAATHSEAEVAEIAERKKINAMIRADERRGFRQIPYIARDLLDEQFLFVCGHQPLPGNFVSDILGAAQNNDCVLTMYQNDDYPMNTNTRIIWTGKQFARIESTDKLAAHKYVRNPYVISKDIIERSKADDFGHTFSYYVYLHWKEGGKVGVVDASMPPEFDYDDELERTKKFLDPEK